VGRDITELADEEKLTISSIELIYRNWPGYNVPQPVWRVNYTVKNNEVDNSRLMFDVNALNGLSLDECNNPAISNTQITNKGNPDEPHVDLLGGK
jgi:hypothetical protein